MRPVLIADEKQNVLAKHIATEIKLPLVEPHMSIFADSEMRITFEDPLELLPNSHAIMVHATSRPVHDNLIWLLLVSQALQTHQVKKISALIPYFGYGRQDAGPNGKEGAVHVIIQLIEQTHIADLITVDLHVPNIINFFSIPVYNITLERFIADFLKKQFTKEELTIIAPDKGAIDRAEQVAQLLDVPVMLFQKERYAINKTRVIASQGSCITQCAVIIDDIIDTGSTIINVAQELQKSHPSCKIYAFGVHAVFSDNAADCLQESVLQKVWVTNTIQLSIKQQFEKLEVIDISSELVKPLHEIT